MKAKKFDVFVIGSGIAGQTVAKACIQAGKKVAIADNREFGGTCSNRGCDPKKILLGATEAFEFNENLKGKGIAKSTKIDWKQLQKFKSNYTDSVPPSTEKNLKELGLKLYHQSPKFVDEQTLSVEGKLVTADQIVIATGQIPRTLSISGEKYLKS